MQFRRRVNWFATRCIVLMKQHFFLLQMGPFFLDFIVKKLQLEMRSKRLQTLQSRKLNKLIWKSTSTFEFLVEILLNNQNVKLKYYDSWIAFETIFFLGPNDGYVTRPYWFWAPNSIFGLWEPVFAFLTPKVYFFLLHVKFQIDRCITRPYWFWALGAYFHLFDPKKCIFSSTIYNFRLTDGSHDLCYFWAPQCPV
jgi:hypothetical protein